ncbi:DOC family protein [Trematosphaeria pertusa]|uniref:DOC family protein n=1 Tax=Trematosphaeria pertusa TaxID=390896 RepID=A0A6A6HVF2_9PLEO|nr:DOC family protein [Trematosphaeria pertusa]KAF2241543.1 DOC family protein [Trematosphaeria pertusa]
MASDVVKFRSLTASQVIRLHNSFITSAKPTQPSKLESAMQSLMSIKNYTNQQNVFQLAASLSDKIIKTHAFQDGNKRTALVAADMFLKINGYKLQTVPLQPDAAKQPLENALDAVCTDAWTVEQLGQFYQQMATAIEEWTPEIMAYKNGATGY